jgi:hypothetical protein
MAAAVLQKLSPAPVPGPDRSMQKALEVLKQMKASGASWAYMAERVLHDFGVQLDKDQLKALVR